jgi:hypothetical protein
MAALVVARSLRKSLAALREGSNPSEVGLSWVFFIPCLFLLSFA